MRTSRRLLLRTTLGLALGLVASPIAKATSKVLQIYAIDVEGGQATLIITPSGESLLVDAGWPDFNGRDADRIVAATKVAGVHTIDYVVITHYHRDHVGGVPQLASKIPIRTFVDHGPNLQDAQDPREDYTAYLNVVSRAKREIVKPRDTIPIRDIRVQVISAAGEVLKQPLEGGGQTDPYCGLDPEPETDVGENARSTGILVTFGEFRFIDLGDLTRKKELEIFCPKNLVGTVDLFLVSHHGYSESNSKAMVWALHPRSAIMDNGAHKGGTPGAWQIVHDSPELPDIWQLHYAVDAGPGKNSDAQFIANPEGGSDAGNYIKVTAKLDGSFRILNSRNQYFKDYPKGKSKGEAARLCAAPQCQAPAEIER